MLHGRMSLYAPSEMDPARRRVYDAILSGPRGGGSLTDADGRLSGPFNHMLIDPVVGTEFEKLGAALRFSADLEPRMREFTILESARAMRSSYEWQAHARAALAVGATDDELAAILAGVDSETMSRSENLARAVVRGSLVDHRVTEELFEQAAAELGESRIYDVIMLAGFYVSVSLVLTTWAIPMPDGVESVF